jgi:ubiquinol-cytochrome c reductase cytochrome b subunit
MKRWLGGLGDWFEERLKLKETFGPLIRHPVPRGLVGPAGWFYVFGSASLTLFLLQIVTGICLALVYVPSADQAYESLQYLNYDAYLGWFLRALHNTAASGMVIMVLVHMVQVFLWGAFKYPRELTWLAGVGLLFLTLGMAFTGQVLRWDTDAYWGTGIGASMLGRVPWIGPALVHLLLGGPMIGADTLSRFFALHVFVIPAVLIALLALHLYLVVRKGISDVSVPGKVVDPRTYDALYEKELKEGVPFFPEPFWRDVIMSSLTVVVVVVLAAVLGPTGPAAPPNPAQIAANPRPDWPFLWLFALLALSPPQMETAIILVLPAIIVAVLVLVPFVAKKGERHPRRRPVAVLSVILILLPLGVLTWLGTIAPWSPDMFAWSGTPIPEDLVKGRTPLELQGAVVLQNKDCRNCHALEGMGGRRGPELDTVATRLTPNQMVRQVIQGGGNMPAYGEQLKPAEVEALVAFLSTLHPKNQPPARSAAPEEPRPSPSDH